MLLLAHVGYTVGGGWAAQHLRLRNAVDFRLLALMAIFPDIVDRVLYLLIIPDAQSGRLVAHTLVFQVVLFAALVAIRREFWIYGLASLLHLALDASGSAGHVLWPALGAGLENVEIEGGSAAAAGQSYGERVLDRLEVITSNYGNADLLAILFDVGGLAVLMTFATWARLRERGRLLMMVGRGRAVAAR